MSMETMDVVHDKDAVLSPNDFLSRDLTPQIVRTVCGHYGRVPAVLPEGTFLKLHGNKLENKVLGRAVFPYPGSGDVGPIAANPTACSTDATALKATPAASVHGANQEDHDVLVTIPLSYTATFNVLAQAAVYKSVEEMKKTMPRYVQVKRIPNGLNTRVTLAEGDHVELLDITKRCTKSGVVELLRCKHGHREILVPMTSKGCFEVVPDPNLYTIDEVLKRFPLPQKLQLKTCDPQTVKLDGYHAGGVGGGAGGRQPPLVVVAEQLVTETYMVASVLGENLQHPGEEPTQGSLIMFSMDYPIYFQPTQEVWCEQDREVEVDQVENSRSLEVYGKPTIYCGLREGGAGGNPPILPRGSPDRPPINRGNKPSPPHTEPQLGQGQRSHRGGQGLGKAGRALVDQEVKGQGRDLLPPTLADFKSERSELSVEEVCHGLTLLNIPTKSVQLFLTNQIDGKLLMELPEAVLVADLGLTQLQAIKTSRWARGWTPKHL